MQWTGVKIWKGQYGCNTIEIDVGPGGLGSTVTSLANPINPYRRHYYQGLTLSPGEKIEYHDGKSLNNPVSSIVGPFSGDYDTGCIQFNTGFYSALFVVVSGCEENFDCPEGEKCVEGECVPCDDQAATHYQVRFEYEELVTTSDANQVMSTLSSIYPISGSEGQIIQGQETSGLWYYPRIRFCNSEGEARPYTGALAFYGYCNPDGSTALYSNNKNLTEKPWVIGEKARTDSVSANPWSVPRLLIEFIEQSKIVYEVVCSGATGEEFPPIEPVEPTEPEEPLPPDPGDPPDEIDEPLPPDPVDGTGGGEPPPEPQEGLCECEKYLAKMILAGTQQIRNAIVEHGNQLDARLADGHAVLYERITSLERVLYQQHSETNRLLYELSMFLFQPYFAEIVLIRKTLQKSLESGDDGLIDIVKKGLVEGDNGLVDYVKDFVDQYEPVTIENEYRTQSHRVIDNLDEVVGKL